MLPAWEIKMLEAELEKRKQEREVKDNEAITRLAEYEDSGLSPEEVQELAKAKADGRLKILPAKPGDIIYRPAALQFCWVITKVEIYEDEIVFIDDSDNIFRPDDIGKTVFLTREAAEKVIPTCNVTKLPCAGCNPCCEHRGVVLWKIQRQL